ncbi:uncharacterized protein LOC129596657 [Paramacrobiotus metropolitanus]|uniref:uncharacterized protein LOC129596657 n=1 Tax=Paramacrobiotus metropolitanus TaxID=2943436 RepID=UPI0024464472|nr:uncharacterized protein LOC129596657 [Paramacrobiotus metropolitanus]
MFVYGDHKHSVCACVVHAWNAVDVLIDGRLHHGRVINVAETGLIIDFQCPAGRSQLIEYGTIFRCDDQNGPPHSAQVLLRRHPDGAWIWYPGRVVPVGSCWHGDYELVQVQRHYGTVTELLPRERIRETPSEADLRERRVEVGDFVVRSSPLPVAHMFSASLPFGRIFDDEFSRRHKVLLTAVLGREIFYLQRQNSSPLTIQQVADICRTARTIDQSRPTLSSREVVVDTRMRLPTELLVEIFQSLDSIHRVRCRRVCLLWNILLTTEAHFPDVWVSGSDETHGMYGVVACLLKCLTSAPKVVLLSRLPLQDSRQLSAPIRYILQPHRLPVLVLYDCAFSEALDRIKEVVGSATELNAHCARDKVVWKN